MEQPATAFYTTTSSQGRGRGRGCGRGRGSGRNHNNNHGGSSSNPSPPSQSPRPRPLCQICNRVGYLALDCFNRLDLSFQGRQPPEKLQAMAAAKHGDTQWFTDTGATNHVTSDLSNLSIHSDYVGTDGLAVGNGKTIGEDPLPQTYSLPTLETAQPEVGSSGWKSTARRVVSGAPPAALENPEDRVPPTPGRTHNRIRSPRANHKGYKCNDPVSRRIYMSRHVVFDEHRYPFAQNDDLISTNTNSHAQSTDDPVVLGQLLPNPIAQPLHNCSHLTDGLIGTGGSPSSHSDQNLLPLADTMPGSLTNDPSTSSGPMLHFELMDTPTPVPINVPHGVDEVFGCEPLVTSRQPKGALSSGSHEVAPPVVHSSHDQLDLLPQQSKP
ncbi:Regulator of rDNA transcription protein 15 [Cinnamomum micranthum f. kanehirae]|uniref:Regulator of rDNA transcription protein 15 n=1 Tax=Cinnamomum micranthum f. kanehirae TaxID=337451 RepID=A0A443PJN1_9MAGN|nr:Regulator of rDNA transcription protein 15 [Cinnamomum micranthum f. kanehirae]